MGTVSDAVLVAAIAAGPATLAAFASWRGTRTNSQRLGNPNGRGDLAQQIGHLSDWADSHTRQHRDDMTELTTWRKGLGDRLTHIDRKLVSMSKEGK